MNGTWRRHTFSPDLILCGWLGSRHQLTNSHTGELGDCFLFVCLFVYLFVCFLLFFLKCLYVQLVYWDAHQFVYTKSRIWEISSEKTEYQDATKSNWDMSKEKIEWQMQWSSAEMCVCMIYGTTVSSLRLSEIKSLAKDKPRVLLVQSHRNTWYVLNILCVSYPGVLYFYAFEILFLSNWISECDLLFIWLCLI